MSTFEPLRRSPLADQAAERLRERISAGEWPVGTKLPGETTLARELGVGRSTVREAIRAVAGAGMLESRQGAGVFVLAAEPVAAWDQRLRQAAVADVFEVRALLEPEAARLAALRRDETDLTALAGALAARRAAVDSDDSVFVEADIAVHAAVVAAAHNPVLTSLFQSFRPRLRVGLLDLIRTVPVRESDPLPGDAAHAALVEAIQSRDPDKAAHILRAEMEVIQSLLRAR